MDNAKFTALCTGTGALGGTLKGTWLSVSTGISFMAMAEVVFYAVLSALAAFLTKVVLDRLMRKCGSEKGRS